MSSSSSNVSSPSSTASSRGCISKTTQALKTMDDIKQLKVDVGNVHLLLKNTAMTQRWSSQSRRDVEETLEKLSGKMKYLQDNKAYLKSHINAFDFDEALLTEDVSLIMTQIQGLKASISSNQSDHQ
ncbi:hypothetical protein MMC11_007997, partial [Xylographa trunciseda]|nr:hypothetical protein [Xylographa trunciseda]